MAVADVLDLLRCPRCATDLTFTGDGRSVRCAQGHSYDLARQGQLNLLGGKEPRNADTAGMVAARDRFLTAGHYRPIAEQLLAAAPQHPDLRLLDVGAGTGYYLGHLLDALPGSRGVALDVSAAAARRAARSSPRAGAVVADAWRSLPVGDGRVDLVLDVFAPRNPAEFHRVLTPQGRLVTVTPAPEHLQELRGPLDLLDIQPDKQDRLQESLAKHFERDSLEAVRFSASWDAATLHDLVAMGPNAFHLTMAEITERVATVPLPVAVTVAVEVSGWAPRH